MRLRGLWRGFQSAVFYYLSCVPWTKFISRRRRRKQVNRDSFGEEMYMYEASKPYRQPAAYTTNPFWTEEIRLGPGPPVRSLTKKQRSALERLKTGDSTTQGSNSSQDQLKRSTSFVGTDGTPRSVINLDGERWKLHQRPDEHLWGQHRPSQPDVSSMNASTRDTDDVHDNDTQTSRIVFVNPPLTHQHPPVVSNIAHGTSSNMWMLQPPPPVAVMEGKEPYVAAEEGSAGSTSSRRDRSMRSLNKCLTEDFDHD